MKFKNFFIFLILLVIFISACNQTTSPQPPATTFQPVAWLSGQPGAVNLTPTEGNGPFQCAITAGTLPAGFALNNCVISGTAPVLAGGTTKSISPPFTITITNGAGQQQTLEYNILTVASLPAIIFNEPGTCIVKQKCSVNLIAQVNGGTPPYHFQSDTFRNGAPPMGMIVDVNGVLIGTPSKTGQYTFGVCVVDVVAASKCGQTFVFVVEEGELIEGGVVEESKDIPETWSGTLTGIHARNPDRHDAQCYKGEFSATFRVKFTVQSDLANKLNQKGEFFPDSPNGVFGGEETVSIQPISTLEFYKCSMSGGSLSDTAIEVIISQGTILIGAPLGSEVTLPERTDGFDGTSSWVYQPKLDQIILEPESISDTTISGTWTLSSSFKGTFTLTKQ